MILLFQSSFRLSEKNEKDKKRKVLTPVSATPTHMLRICVNPSFKHLLSPRGDRCEHTSPTVRQLLNHGYRFETLKRRLGFAAVPCQAMANLAVGVWVRVWVQTERDKICFAQYTCNTSSTAIAVPPFCPSLGDADRVCSANRSIPHWRRLIVTSVSAHIRFTPANPIMRACRQCVHESARLFRALCSHAWYS